MIPEMYWAIFGAIAAIATAVAATINGWFKATGFWKQFVAWVSALGLTFAAWGLGFIPALGTPEWLWVGLQGVCVGLVSNGIYDIPFVKKIYELIFGKKEPEQVEKQ